MALSKDERARLKAIEKALKAEEPMLAVRLAQSTRHTLIQIPIIGMTLLLASVPLFALLGLILDNVACEGVAAGLLITTVAIATILRHRRIYPK